MGKTGAKAKVGIKYKYVRESQALLQLKFFVTFRIAWIFMHGGNLELIFVIVSSLLSSNTEKTEEKIFKKIGIHLIFT